MIARDVEESLETRYKRNEAGAGLVKELFKDKEVAMSTTNISMCGPGKEDSEVSSLIKFKMEIDSNRQAKGLSPNMDKKATGRGRIKKMAREKTAAHEKDIISQSPRSGKKRLGNIKALKEIEGKDQKRVCRELDNNSPNVFDETAVAAWQHRQEQ